MQRHTEWVDKLHDQLGLEKATIRKYGRKAKSRVICHSGVERPERVSPTQQLELKAEYTELKYQRIGSEFLDLAKECLKMSCDEHGRGKLHELPLSRWTLNRLKQKLGMNSISS